MRLLVTDLPGPINIGNPSEQSILDLAHDVIAATSSTSDIVFIERPEDDTTVRKPDISLARRELGWEPQIDSIEGMRRTADWFRNELGLSETSSMSAARDS